MTGLDPNPDDGWDDGWLRPRHGFLVFPDGRAFPVVFTPDDTEVRRFVAYWPGGGRVEAPLAARLQIDVLGPRQAVVFDLADGLGDGEARRFAGDGGSSGGR